jgi:hypothetical protein
MHDSLELKHELKSLLVRIVVQESDSMSEALKIIEHAFQEAIAQLARPMLYLVPQPPSDLLIYSVEGIRDSNVEPKEPCPNEASEGKTPNVYKIAVTFRDPIYNNVTNSST